MVDIRSVAEEVFQIGLDEVDILSLKLNDIKEWDSMGNMNLLFYMGMDLRALG